MNTPANPIDPIRPSRLSWLLVAVAWTLVGIPLAWGIFRTLRTAVKIL